MISIDELDLVSIGGFERTSRAQKKKERSEPEFWARLAEVSPKIWYTNPVELRMYVDI